MSGESNWPGTYASACLPLGAYRTLTKEDRQDVAVMLKTGTYDDRVASHFVVVDPIIPDRPDEDNVPILDPAQPMSSTKRPWRLSDSARRIREDDQIDTAWRQSSIDDLQLGGVWVFAAWRSFGFESARSNQTDLGGASMAIDNFYRLIVTGPRDVAPDFRRSVAQRVDRPTIGKVKGWREFVPLSIKAIRQHHEKVRRATSVAREPFEISVWPTRPLVRGRAEIRYQFQTRNSDFLDFLKPLSRCFPALTFVLVTLYLDDSQIASFLIRHGVARGRKLSQSRRQWHWDGARERFDLAGDAVYEDDAAEFFAEEGMLDEALAYWMSRMGRASASRCSTLRGATILQQRRRSWWNRPKIRDLDFERHLELYEINVSEARARQKASRRAGQK